MIPETQAEANEHLIDLPVPKGEDLEKECHFIREEIAEAKSFAERMHESRYAIYYQAKSRQRIIDLTERAKIIACP